MAVLIVYDRRISIFHYYTISSQCSYFPPLSSCSSSRAHCHILSLSLTLLRLPSFLLFSVFLCVSITRSLKTKKKAILSITFGIQFRKYTTRTLHSDSTKVSSLLQFYFPFFECLPPTLITLFIFIGRLKPNATSFRSRPPSHRARLFLAFASLYTISCHPIIVDFSLPRLKKRTLICFCLQPFQIQLSLPECISRHSLLLLLTRGMS